MSNLGPLIFLLVFILPPVIQAIGKLREKAKAEKTRQEHIRSRRESIRTGGPQSSLSSETTQPEAKQQRMPARVDASVSAEDRLRQLERDRQARLRELRARASGASRSTANPAQRQQPGGASRPPKAPRSTKATPTTPTTRTTPGQQRGPRPTPRTVGVQTTRPRQSPQVPSTAQTPQVREFLHKDLGAPKQRETKNRRSSTVEIGSESKKTRAGFHLKVDRQSLRQAVILSEILRPPVSLQENDRA